MDFLFFNRSFKGQSYKRKFMEFHGSKDLGKNFNGTFMKNLQIENRRFLRICLRTTTTFMDF